MIAPLQCPRASSPVLPVEIWIYILRLASNVYTNLARTDAHDPFPDFPHGNIDLWGAGPPDASYKAHYHLRTKYALVRVCRQWSIWCTPFLYEDIEIGRYPCHELLLRSFQESLISAAHEASYFITLPELSSDAAVFFGANSPELAKTMGLGHHVRKITICKDSGKRPSQRFLAYVALILQCCPNVTSFSASWRKSPPMSFVDGIRALYGHSLTHLSWRYPLSTDSQMSDCWAVASFMHSFRYLQVLDLRCLGLCDWPCLSAGEQEQLRGCVQLPSVRRLYITQSQGSADLLRLFRLPKLTHIVVDLTTGGKPFGDSHEWGTIVLRWRCFIYRHQAELTYIQVVNSMSEEANHFSSMALFAIYLGGLSLQDVPRLTRVEVPLELILILEADKTMQPISEYMRPIPSLVRLDLRIATPPPYSTINTMKYLTTVQKLGTRHPTGMTQRLFPGLQDIRIIDISWHELLSTIRGLFHPLYRTISGTGIRLLDMEGIELTNALVEELVPEVDFQAEPEQVEQGHI